ncbi:hypothetical protein JW911_04395 [Candidatus Peregrinibacteria bacterium]|nr:hypothetical protein [Candidatus Peregrinibacteria bacterium]
MSVVCFFVAVISIGLFRTVGNAPGLLFLGGGLFVVAWMAETLIPQNVLMHAIMYVSGVGLFCSSLMNAVFPYVMVSVMMFALLALSLAQIILSAPVAPPEDS